MDQINNNELQTFLYCGKNVRTIIKDGEIWWVLKDVCEILGIENSRNVTSRLEDEEKATVHITDISHNGIKQNRVVTVINEYGLYNVILLSLENLRPGSFSIGLRTKYFLKFDAMEPI